MEEKALGEKITQILEETRVVIPGTEVFLAFQLGAVFTEVFQGLPPGLRATHIVSFVLITVFIVLLVSSAPYHRIRERGRNTERTLRYAHHMLLTSMFVTATGISVDVWLVCAIAVSTAAAWWIAPGVWALAMVLWFVLPHNGRRRDAA